MEIPHLFYHCLPNSTDRVLGKAHKRKANKRNHRTTKIEDLKIWSKAYLYVIFKESWGRFVFWIFHIPIKTPTNSIIIWLDLNFSWQNKQMESCGKDFWCVLKIRLKSLFFGQGKPSHSCYMPSQKKSSFNLLILPCSLLNVELLTLTQSLTFLFW